MKLNILLIISTLIVTSTYPFAQSSAKQVEELQRQREELVIKLQQKESELETAKPIAVKRINKQVNKLEEQIASLDSQINLLEHNTNVTNVEKTKEELPDDAELSEVLQPKDYSEEAIITRELEQNDVVNTEQQDITPLKEEPQEEISNDTTSSTSNEDEEDDDPVGTTLFAIGVAILLFIIWLFKRERCPHCGKKGTLRSSGDTRKYQYDEKGNVTRTGVLKRYKCSHCGQYVEKIKWS